MHYTFLYKNSFQREEEYDSLAEAIRSVEDSVMETRLWSIKYVNGAGDTDYYDFELSREFREGKSPNQKGRPFFR
ncbi:hypothetical protein ACNJ7E_14985 [Rhodococcus sp. NM-2]|uniref:hypothetical protein n=1 Tax=Rhodococcus sp. NM-2 TaxID=3401174 RepID=UPI003AAD5800